ncbi:hypothetical protein TNCV_2359341 [Trichonephila clavipes]|nr:hypothetical protein TNCV_2359341 [Trichonephila clavipes]
MKIGNNGNLVLGPFDESTPLLDDRFDELPNQTENKSLRILEANSQVQNAEQRSPNLSFNKSFVHELCDMLRRLVGTTGPDIMIVQFRNEKLVIMALYRSPLTLTPNAAVLFVDVAIQPEVRFIAKQNSLMKIGNNGNLVLGPFDESKSSRLGVSLFDELPKPNWRINHLTAVKSVAILKVMPT